MARAVGACPPSPLSASRPESYRIHVITPMFGGGVDSGINDPVTLIRPTSIRGHLRFWWRATRGMQCADAKTLREREAEIWGSTERRSSVEIEVRITERGQPEQLQVSRESSLPYALFPFKEDSKKGLPWSGIEFELVVRRPDLAKSDVEAALWAWTNFGGIGARTRRGCGALYCSAFAPGDRRLSDWWRDKPFAIPIRPPLFSWPTVQEQPLLCAERGSRNAWNRAIKLMFDFRQGPDMGRERVQGRSLWPEADSLRAITGKGAVSHLKPTTQAGPACQPAFPRAELGLPIVFHFKDNDDALNNSELTPEGHSRMSSPIILKPLAIDSIKAMAMVLRLITKSPDGLKLKFETGDPAIPPLIMRNEAFSKYKRSPMGSPGDSKPKRSKKGSALEAFMAFAGEQGFKAEVQP